MGKLSEDRFIADWGAGTWTAPAETTPQPHEAHRLSLDSTKAREQLGWVPVWDAPSAVHRTAAWYREYYRAPVAARDLVDDQLRIYQDDARTAGLPWADPGEETTS